MLMAMLMASSARCHIGIGKWAAKATTYQRVAAVATTTVGKCEPGLAWIGGGGLLRLHLHRYYLLLYCQTCWMVHKNNGFTRWFAQIGVVVPTLKGGVGFSG